MKYQIKQEGGWFYPQWFGWAGLVYGGWRWQDFEEWNGISMRFSHLESAKGFLSDNPDPRPPKISVKIHPYP